MNNIIEVNEMNGDAVVQAVRQYSSTVREGAESISTPGRAMGGSERASSGSGNTSFLSHRVGRQMLRFF